MEHIKVENRIGLWYEIDRKEVNGETYLLVEHETYGDEAGCLLLKMPKDIEYKTSKMGKKCPYFPKEFEISETWDDIETSLQDAELFI